MTAAVVTASAAVPVSGSVPTPAIALPGAAGTTFAEPLTATVLLVLYASMAIIASGAAAVVYRWYFGQSAPEGLSVLLGTALVALYLNTVSLGVIIGGDDAGLFRFDVVAFNVAALGAAAVTSPIGRRLGDAIAVETFVLAGPDRIEDEVGRVVRTVGRLTAVRLPPADDIGDIEMYEPVTSERKAELADTVLTFPRRIDDNTLRERLIERVKADYGIAHVDVDLAADRSIDYMAVGARMAGLGATLPPGTAAAAVRADPANGATPGDTVQLWRAPPEADRVATAELRATAGDVATVALDEADAADLTDGPYRLVTLPAESRVDREFAALLRNADETMTAVDVESGADLVGRSVAGVGAVVAAVRSADGPVTAIPPRNYAFAAGDTVYVIGRPDALRRIEAAAATGDGDPLDGVDGAGDSDRYRESDWIEDGEAGSDGSGGSHRPGDPTQSAADGRDSDRGSGAGSGS